MRRKHKPPDQRLHIGGHITQVQMTVVVTEWENVTV